MKDKTCCFTGHRNIPTEIKHELFTLTETAIENVIKTDTDILEQVEL